MQADSTGGTDDDTKNSSPDGVLPRCPPPPEHVPSFGCEVEKCHSDKECHDIDQKCCYNGCTFTCMTTMPPPAGKTLPLKLIKALAINR